MKDSPIISTVDFDKDGVQHGFLKLPHSHGGAFQICEYRKELEELFHVGEEIETFQNIDELKEKIRFYLENPQKRKEIAEKGYLRAHKEHTYEKRLSELVSHIERK